MQSANGQFGIGTVDQDRNLDLGGGDGLDVDVLLGKRLEGAGSNASMAAHADTDDRNLGKAGLVLRNVEADLGLVLVRT